MWLKISEWFGEVKERSAFVKNFNRQAKNAFVSGEALVLLEARVSVGESEFKHAFSKFLGGGFRIKAMSNQTLSKEELIQMGKGILSNSELVRTLVSLGWDTLEIHDSKGPTGYKWELEKYTNL